MINALDWSGRRSNPNPHASEGKAAEAGWIRAAQRGDRKAMDHLVRAHQDRVYGFLYRMTNDRDLALDLAQETFLKAFKGLNGFKPDAAMGPWLLAIARNSFLDQVRRRAADPSQGGADLLEDDGAGAEDPALLRLSSDTGIMEALQHVPSPLREALVLRHVEDLSYEQIAEALEAPLGTVKTWLHRGRASLRMLVEKGGGE
ncbi:ECF RNA polymerase sigma factor SigE [compost metagenome]